MHGQRTTHRVFCRSTAKRRLSPSKSANICMRSRHTKGLSTPATDARTPPAGTDPSGPSPVAAVTASSASCCRSGGTNQSGLLRPASCTQQAHKQRHSKHSTHGNSKCGGCKHGRHVSAYSQRCTTCSVRRTTTTTEAIHWMRYNCHFYSWLTP